MSKSKISPHYPLFEHMSIYHDLVLIESELQEIINVVRSFDAQTQELIEQNRELVSVLSRIVERQFDSNHSLASLNHSIAEAKELLTKYQKP